MLARYPSDNSARLWDAETGANMGTLRWHGDWVQVVALSRDGKLAVTGSRDGTARVWDAATGNELVVLRGHQGRIEAVAFSDDGLRLVTASGDGGIACWEGTPRAAGDVRRQLALAARERARPIVERLHVALGDWGAVASQIRQDGSLEPGVKEQALNLVLMLAAQERDQQSQPSATSRRDNESQDRGAPPNTRPSQPTD